MEIFLAVFLFIIGAVLVVKGADFFVDAASWMSDVTGISKVVVGATIIAVATSGPELFVSLIAALEGKVDMALGNVVGSNICNLGIGFSLIAICRPAQNKDNLFLTRGIIMVVTSLVLLLFCFLGAITYVCGIIMIAIYIVFTYINIRFDKSEAPEPLAQLNVENLEVQNSSEHTSDEAPKKKKRYKKPTNKKEIIWNIVKFVGGLAGIIFGSQLIVDNATVLATKMGVSEMFIGLTIVAIGTSLPEIMTTIVAIVKKEDNLGIGNIIGSNIFNTTVIIAVSVFAGGSIAISQGTLVDMPVSIALMLIAVIPTAITKKVTRWQGILLAVFYVGYMVYLGMNG